MRCRALVVWVVVGLGLLGASPVVGADRPCWAPAVSGPIIDPFREPPCPWCAGNRGIEYAVGPRTVVRAVVSGTVIFSGPVVGVHYVVVELPNGWRLTYGRLTATTLASGDVVVARSAVGTASTRFYFGLRIGDAYTDPQPYLGTPVGRPRLIPIDGTPARPAPAPTLRCAGAGRPPSDNRHRVPSEAMSLGATPPRPDSSPTRAAGARRAV